MGKWMEFGYMKSKAPPLHRGVWSGDPRGIRKEGKEGGTEHAPRVWNTADHTHALMPK